MLKIELYIDKEGKWRGRAVKVDHNGNIDIKWQTTDSYTLLKNVLPCLDMTSKDVRVDIIGLPEDERLNMMGVNPCKNES